MNRRYNDERAGYRIRELTIDRVTARQAGRYGDKTYLTVLPERSTYSFQQIDALSNSIANGLLGMHPPAKPHIATFMGNSAEALIAMLAIGKLAGTVVPINTAAKGVQLRYYLDLAEVTAIIVDGALVPALLDAAPRAGQLRDIVLFGADESVAADLRGRDFQVAMWEELARSPSHPPGVPVRFDDLAMLSFTSGTTGPSKATMHTQAKCLLNPISHLETFEYGEHDVLYTCLPVFHNNALYATLYPALLAGAGAVMSRRFSAQNFWKEVRELNVTSFRLLGSMTNILWSLPPSPDDRNHKVVQCGSAPMPKFAEGFEERFGLRLTSSYGLSDFGVPTSFSHRSPGSKLGSAGTARPGWEVRITDDDGFDVPPGTPGEIALRTDNLFEASSGYYRMPEKTLESFRNGWFHTGDRGYLDEDGYLYFVDRKKDSLRRRGENVSAFEVEQTVLKHPAVADVAVFAVRSDMSEDEVAAAVVWRSEAALDPHGLIEHCAKNMAYFMVPRYLHFVDDLPRTLTQKVEKYKLEAWAAENRGSLWDREKEGIVVNREGFKRA